MDKRIYPLEKLSFSYDIGHASIGWAVIKTQSGGDSEPDILDCGVVLFEGDGCLASKRRTYRRMRRNIRSTRQRINRLGKILVAYNVITEEERNTTGDPAPFYWAAQALRNKANLTGKKLWDILRWYAHNRGYDGNKRWAGDEINEDIARVKAGEALMDQYKTQSTAETICSMLALDIQEDHPNFTDKTPAYKTHGVAFSRRKVINEVTDILESQLNKLKGLTLPLIKLITSEQPLSKEEGVLLKQAGLRALPKRYVGGLLFGQLLPRFDNRIIRSCPITWAQTYDAEYAKLGNKDLNEAEEKQCRDKANVLSKVPNADTPEFREYRFARILSNLRADAQPISSDLRKEIMGEAKTKGKLTAKEIDLMIKKHYGKVITNVSNYFTMHPDSEDALLVDPALNKASSALNNKKNELNFFWKHLSLDMQNLAISAWKKGKTITLKECFERMKTWGQNTDNLQFSIDNLPDQERTRYPSLDILLQKKFGVKKSSGRAPYSRIVMKQVVHECLEGFDPASPCKSEKHPEGEGKEKDGILYSLMDPTSRVKELEQTRALSDLTNNHLIRHRLLILERLVKDMIKQYADNDSDNVSRVIVEMGREVSAFSGMTAKQITQELNSRMKSFKSAVDYLEKEAPNLQITGGLIRKCRIAMDMAWMCPFTGVKYDVQDLTKLEREHIVPYANTKTNALHALVLTYPEVNKMKGKRTAYEFISECAGESVNGMPNLAIMNLRFYKTFVDHLKIKSKHIDDFKRKKKRKELLLVDKISNKTNKDGVENEFTMGQMTQSSHLMKLAMRQLKHSFKNAAIDSIPGVINAEIRKAWDVMGCLSAASPDIFETLPADPNIPSSKQRKVVRTKDEIRKVTHMHHALDAIVLALAAHYIPGHSNGKLWQALLRRHKTREDMQMFQAYSIIKINTQNNAAIVDLPATVKEKIRQALGKRRVMQHIPADMHSSRTDEMIWGVVNIKGEGARAKVTLRQYKCETKGLKRQRTLKTKQTGANKLIGLEPTTGAGKLKTIKGVIVINDNFGIALDPSPTIIPHHQVYQTIQRLVSENGGKHIRILRKGMLIRLSNQKQAQHNGIWMISGVTNDQRDGLLLSLRKASYIGNLSSHLDYIKAAKVKILLPLGLDILVNNYTAYPLD